MKRDLLYRGCHFPPQIISHAVGLYVRFMLSLRDVEELLAQRGFNVSYETIRRWCLNSGPNTFAVFADNAQLRLITGRSGQKTVLSC
jgi:transposase-like protein